MIELTKTVPDYALIVGNPGKQIGWMSEYGYKLEFVNGIAVCQESGGRYWLKNDNVKKVT